MESANGENGEDNEDNKTVKMNTTHESPPSSHTGQLVETADFAINSIKPPKDSVNHVESPVRKVGKLEIMFGGCYPSAAAMNNSSPRSHHQGYCRATG